MSEHEFWRTIVARADVRDRRLAGRQRLGARRARARVARRVAPRAAARRRPRAQPQRQRPALAARLALAGLDRHGRPRTGRRALAGRVLRATAQQLVGLVVVCASRVVVVARIAAGGGDCGAPPVDYWATLHGWETFQALVIGSSVAVAIAGGSLWVYILHLF
jgi:hypothetical protein